MLRRFTCGLFVAVSMHTELRLRLKPVHTDMIAFLPPSASAIWRTQRVCPLVARCCVSSPEEVEPRFLAAIRASAPALLAERGLAIASMQWADQCLRVLVSTRADVDGRLDAAGVTSDECQFASRVLAALLDEDDSLMPSEEYTLEVSSPGTPDVLTRDREFDAFKGFHIRVTTTEMYRKKSWFEGTLHGRTEDEIQINLKGRILGIPRHIVADVKVQAAEQDPGT